MKSHQNALWLLFAVSREQQLYFDQRGIAAVVLGTDYKGVNLPFVDADFRALADHSVGLLTRRGYRRLLLVLPTVMLGGDRVTLAGFDRAVASGGFSLDCYTAKNRQRVAQDIKQWICADRSSRSAVMVIRPDTAVAVLSGLYRLGVCIPADAGFVCRDQHTALDEIWPSVCHYKIDYARVVERMTRIAIKVARGTSGRVESAFVLPEYCEGATL